MCEGGIGHDKIADELQYRVSDNLHAWMMRGTIGALLFFPEADYQILTFAQPQSFTPRTSLSNASCFFSLQFPSASSGQQQPCMRSGSPACLTYSSHLSAEVQSLSAWIVLASSCKVASLGSRSAFFRREASSFTRLHA